MWEEIGNYLYIPKLQRACDYLSILGLKLNHVSERGHSCHQISDIATVVYFYAVCPSARKQRPVALIKYFMIPCKVQSAWYLGAHPCRNLSCIITMAIHPRVNVCWNETDTYHHLLPLLWVEPTNACHSTRGNEYKKVKPITTKYRL